MTGVVTEQLAIADWAADRRETFFRACCSASNFPPSVLRGQLAESWEMPDETTIIVKVRPGVHWHDKAPMNGRELTASDIKFNYRSPPGDRQQLQRSIAARRPAAQNRIGDGHRRIDGGVQAGRAGPLRAVKDIQHVDCLDLPSGGDPAVRRRPGLEESGWHRAHGDDGLRRGQLDHVDQEPQLLGLRREVPGEPIALRRRDRHPDHDGSGGAARGPMLGSTRHAGDCQRRQPSCGRSTKSRA